MTTVEVVVVAEFTWEGRTVLPGERLQVPAEVASRLVQEGLAGGTARSAVPLATWNTPAVVRR